MKYTIKTKRLALRLLRRGDEAALVRNINSKKIYRATLRIPYPYTLKDAQKWIKNSAAMARQKNPSTLNFAIDLDGEVIGGVGLDNIEKEHKAEIGYWLGEKYWGQGIMTEAVKGVTGFGFKQLNLKRIYADVYPSNKASMNVLKKSGYKLEGFMKKNKVKNGKFMDSYQFAKVR